MNEDKKIETEHYHSACKPILDLSEILLEPLRMTAYDLINLPLSAAYYDLLFNTRKAGQDSCG